MEFKYLNAAINNRRDSEPSLYSAMCVVEQLFKDYESEAHDSMESLPVGDEKLPNKLLWLCESLQEIYAQTKDQFVRNRERVAGSMDELSEMREELKEYAHLDDQIENAEEEKIRLIKKLEDAKKLKERYDQLSEECAKLSEELAQEPPLSEEEKAQELEQLKQECEKAQADREEVRAKKAEYEQNRDQLKNEVEQAKDELDAITRQVSDLSEQKNQQVDEREKLNAEYEELSAKSRELSVEIGLLQAKKSNFEKVISNNRITWDQETNSITGIIEDEKKSLQMIFQELGNHRTDLQEESFKLLQDISDKTAEIKLLQEDFDKTKRELEDLDAQISSGNKENEILLKEYNDKKEKLSSLKDSDEKRNQIKNMIKDAEKRILELESTIGDVEDLEAQNAERETKLKALETRKKEAEDNDRRLTQLMTPEVFADINDLDERLSQMEKISRLLTNDSKYLFEKPFDVINASLQAQLLNCKDVISGFRKAVFEYKKLYNA